jgi:hypothetical protein
MDPISALLVAVAAGAATGVGLLFAMKAPLMRMLEKSCPGDDAINFWARFTLVMLVLSPVLFALGFGLPPSEKILAFDLASILVKVITSAFVGGFFAMVGIGIWVGRIASSRR